MDAEVNVDQFLKDVRLLSKIKCSDRHRHMALFEYPFDQQLLSLSPVYRESRKQFLDLGGRFFPRLSSAMRSLSTQDLFSDEIDYTPAASEIDWVIKSFSDVSDPAEEVRALEQFNAISVFHEQNHRILWRLLPRAPKNERDLSRYLNFAESQVVMLDLALADQIGAKLSDSFERMKVIYRSGRVPKRWLSSKSLYRNYLVAAQFATYLILELVNPEDVLPAINYVLPGQKRLNHDAVARAFDISELFTRITNPQWQQRNLKVAAKSLARMHLDDDSQPFEVPHDPLDFEVEFDFTRYVLSEFKI